MARIVSGSVSDEPVRGMPAAATAAVVVVAAAVVVVVAAGLTVSVPNRPCDSSSGPAVNRMDGEPDEFHERVRSAYRDLAAAHPNRILLLDGTRPAGDLAEEILRDARDVLARAGR